MFGATKPLRYCALFLAPFAVTLSAGAQPPPDCQWNDGFFPDGPHETIYAATAFDDGGGSDLYVGGFFRTVGQQLIEGIAS